jgi:hypothetical protein
MIFGCHLILLCQWFDVIVEIIGFFENDSFLKNRVISIGYSSYDSVVLERSLNSALSFLMGLLDKPGLDRFETNGTLHRCASIGPVVLHELTFCILLLVGHALVTGDQFHAE